MEPAQIIIILAAIVLTLMALKYVTKILFRLILVLIVMIIFYMGYQHFSGSNIFDNLNNICLKENTPKCSCFAKPILEDLNSRFTEDELNKLKNNMLKSNIEFGRSYQAKESEIKKCFEELGQNSLLEEILSEIKIKDIFLVLKKNKMPKVLFIFILLFLLPNCKKKMQYV